jgi:3-oxoacyl-[acyl-carrier protein] reductase
LFLAGRTATTLDAVADDLRAAGGTAAIAELDALDERVVDEHANEIAAGGGLDISMNVISHNDVQGTPLAEMSLVASDMARSLTATQLNMTCGSVVD